MTVENECFIPRSVKAGTISIFLFPSDRRGPWRDAWGERRAYSLFDAPPLLREDAEPDGAITIAGFAMMAFMKSCASFMDVDSTGVFIHAASSGLSAFFHCPRTWLAETANEAPINMEKDSDRRSRARCSPSGYGERVPLPRSTRFWNVPPIGRCAAPRAPRMTCPAPTRDVRGTTALYKHRRFRWSVLQSGFPSYPVAGEFFLLLPRTV